MSSPLVMAGGRPLRCLRPRPRNTSPDDVKLMLRALLADRFHLVIHNDTHPLPSFVLRADKGAPKLGLPTAPAHPIATTHPMRRPHPREQSLTTTSPATT